MKKLIFILWLVLMVLGVIGVWERFAFEHKLVNYGSYVPWGLGVAAYIYFIGLSAGAFLISSLVYVFGVKRLEAIGKLALLLALVTLLMALVCIWFDIGHMERGWQIWLSPNFNSMMAWMVWLYSVYFVLLLGETYLAMRSDIVWLAEKQPAGWLKLIFQGLTFGSRDVSEPAVARDRKKVRGLAAIGVPLAIAFHGGVGSLFAVVGAKPYWHTSLMPILFLTGALTSGGALLASVVCFFWKSGEEQKELAGILAKIILGLLCFDLLLEFVEITIPLWGNMEYHTQSLKLVLFGTYWYVFWIFHLLLGSVIPLVLLLARRTGVKGIGIAGFLIASTFLSVRLNIVIPAQVVPELKGLESAFIEPHLMFTYLPSFHEWRLVFFILAFGSALFYAGWKILPVHK
jgi:molybdopterin-containing oxidoreductase family membrane subunit